MKDMCVVRRAMICVLLLRASCSGQQQPSSSTIASLRYFLQAKFPHHKTIELRAAAADLHDDGRNEYIIHLTGRSRCGSGGCDMLVLVPKSQGFAILAGTTITRLPIRVPATKTAGRHDLGVVVGGGGIDPGHLARLRFNGRSYPNNPSVHPSVPPALPLHGEPAGKILLSEEPPAHPVYP